MGYTKELIRFGDFVLIFKVTTEEKLKIHSEWDIVFSENTVTSFLLLMDGTFIIENQIILCNTLKCMSKIKGDLGHRICTKHEY